MWAGALFDALQTLQPDTAVEVDDLRLALRGGFPWHRPDHVRTRTDAAGWWSALHPLFASAYQAAGVPEQLATAAIDRVGDAYYRVDAWELIDGAVDALQLTAAAGYRNAILSNHGPELPHLVAALGLDSFVDRVFTSALIGVEKPNRLIFEHALTALGANGDSWMIGDNPIADVDGARAVGMQAILADGAYPDARGVTVVEAAQQLVRAH